MTGPVVKYLDDNQDGIIDGKMTDVDGDGYIGVGDTVQWYENAFIYEQTQNEYTAAVFDEGFTKWAADLSWDILLKAGEEIIGAGKGITIDIVDAGHQLVFETFGSIDFRVASRIATAKYAEYFNVRNPYDHGDPPPDAPVIPNMLAPTINMIGQPTTVEAVLA